MVSLVVKGKPEKHQKVSKYYETDGKLILEMPLKGVDIVVQKSKFETRIRFPCFCHFVPIFLSPNVINLLH